MLTILGDPVRLLYNEYFNRHFKGSTKTANVKVQVHYSADASRVVQYALRSTLQLSGLPAHDLDVFASAWYPETSTRASSSCSLRVQNSSQKAPSTLGGTATTRRSFSPLPFAAWSQGSGKHEAGCGRLLDFSEARVQDSKRIHGRVDGAHWSPASEA